jgi:hypothetical protein
MTIDHHTVALAIRWLHVVAMALAFGGAFFITWLCWRPRADVVETAVRYEQAFWAAAGVLVMTGIGNLGAFGTSLLEPTTAWGSTLVVKLWLVAALIAISLPRSLYVILLIRGPRARVADLRPAYTITTLLFAAIVAMAIVLAHG